MNGAIWGSDAMRTAIRDVRKLGVNYISIHPYAHIERSGYVRFRPANNTDYLQRAIKIAHEEKMTYFWKPHLAYWGSFKWRGAITFKSEVEWRRFFVSYERWIVDHAKFAESAKVPLFAVGTELDQTIHRSEWKQIIRHIRKVYRGKITYAANWDSFAKIPFWRELDFIGIQAYFPVTTAGEAPSKRSIDAYWDKWMDELGRFSKKNKRQILFTELGYTRSTAAAEKPWAPKMIGDHSSALAVQKLVMSRALDRAERAPFVTGAFLWKWIPGFAPWERDFSMRDKPIQSIIRRHWR